MPWLKSAGMYLRGDIPHLKSAGSAVWRLDALQTRGGAWVSTSCCDPGRYRPANGRYAGRARADRCPGLLGAQQVGQQLRAHRARYE